MKTGWRRLGEAGLLIASMFSLAGCSKTSDSEGQRANEPVLVEPHVGVGKVRAGMTVQQVIAELGEPQRRTASALEYARLGLAVVHETNGVVQAVMCGDVTGIRGPFVKTFIGRTKEGIGMNSTREEVVRAYGEPTTNERFAGGLESLKYIPLGITFTLEGGKVHHMIVMLGGSREPDRAVTLEPASPQK